jgi:Ala-tRNA(Pro) deacylase
VTIAASVQSYLDREGAAYETIAHEHTRDSNHTAQAARVPGDRLAKCVVLEDDSGYLMAVVPSTHKVDLGALHRTLQRNLGLASEPELVELFKDCEPGALPPLGAAYGMQMILDDSLAGPPDIYFEAGDHVALVHMRNSEFMRLMENVPRGRISYHM